MSAQVVFDVCRYKVMHSTLEPKTTWESQHKRYIQSMRRTGCIFRWLRGFQCKAPNGRWRCNRHAHIMDEAVCLRAAPQYVANEGHVPQHDIRLHILYCQATTQGRILRENRIFYFQCASVEKRSSSLLWKNGRYSTQQTSDEIWGCCTVSCVGGRHAQWREVGENALGELLQRLALA